MKLLASITVFSLVTLFYSCSGEDNSGTNPSNTIKLTDTTLATDEVVVDSALFSDRPSTEEMLESFEYCKENAENSMTCKYFIAKAICWYYDITDFETEDGRYVDFEEIRPIVLSSKAWHLAGPASSQSALDAAMNAANEGKAAIAISERDKYGHVVLILPGKGEKAPAWGGLTCPNVASFFMVPGLEPFVDKSMAYAWNSPDGIQVYVRD
ncbi:MAG: hypothetical protein K1X56_03315 [Flavobacteriales bacterium]|nr:hypothetical protein [Flavobacteriales bacterium]